MRTARPGRGSRSEPTQALPYSAAWTLPGADGNRALKAVATDLAANTGQDVHDVHVDRVAPSGGSVSYVDGYDTTGTLTITTSNGTDSGSGVNGASGLIQRDAISLASGTCGTFPGSWTGVTSPDTVASGNCFLYRYRISDLAGNVATYTSGNVAKVDTSAPSAPTVSFSALTNAVASGQTVYFQPGVGGGFTVTGSSNDAQSGIGSYAFPALGSGWSDAPAGASDDYSFSSSAADPVEPNHVTAQNNAGLDSSPTSFTVTADGTAPASSIACDGAACAGGWYTSTVSVSLSASDGGSGLQEIRYTTDGTDPSPINGTVYSAPFDVSVTTSVKFRAYDLLGNEETVGSQLVRVDTSAPAAPALTLSESPASAKQHVSGTTLFYNPQGGNAGSFTVDAATSDAAVRHRPGHLPGARRDDRRRRRPSSPYQGSYSWTGASGASGSQTVTAHNNAGLTSTASFTTTPDTAPPSGGSVGYPNGYASGSVTITTGDGNDALSGVDASTGVIERDSTNLVAGVCDPFTGSWSAVTSPDSTIVTGHCYQYRYRVSDNVGNNAVYTSANVVKVSSSAPSAPSLTLAEAPGSPNQHVSGTTIFYNPQRRQLGHLLGRRSTWPTPAARASTASASRALAGHDRWRRRRDEPVPDELRLELGRTQRSGPRRRYRRTTTPASRARRPSRSRPTPRARRARARPSPPATTRVSPFRSRSRADRTRSPGSIGGSEWAWTRWR